VLADQVRGDTLLLARRCAREGEDVPEEVPDPAHRRDCILGQLARKQQAGRFAERVVEGFDDGGSSERIVLWIERKEGGIWAVGRAVNPQHRTAVEPRADDYIFEGFELQDALDAANDALEDDAEVAANDGSEERYAPFKRTEILEPLERWFFGHT
jgi:hypothetical protein